MDAAVGGRQPRGVTAGPFRPTSDDELAPTGPAAKAAANLAALRVLAELDRDDRPASAADQQILGRWSSWGSLPGVFDPAERRFDAVRAELAELLDDDGWRAAERTTLNAHYTPLRFARSVWSAAARLGLDCGRVLEPGCGSGTFLAAAPADGFDLVGVELDPITARIAAHLHPDARIHNESFAATRYPDGTFDATLGNVPFGKVALSDPVHNRSGHSIHNHFLIKSLRLTRPGGLVACFTSRFTLDARSPAARREIAELADLLGAVRLPEGAFRGVAGTDTVIDLLVLRRREPGRPAAGVSFEQAVDLATPDGPVTANQLFAEHPGWVLGDLRAVNGQYHQRDLTVRPDNHTPIGEQLDRALDGIVAAAGLAGLGVTARPDPPVRTSDHADIAAQTALPDLRPWHKEGSLLAGGGGFARITGGQPEPFQPAPAGAAGELQALIGLRDTLLELFHAQAATWDDTTFEPLRRDLNRRYDNYTRRWGPLNRFSTARTGRTDPDSGTERLRRIVPRMGGFRRDPDCHAVFALEHFDPDTGTATKASVFTRRVVAPRQPRLGADSAHDALGICLDTHGRPDLAEIGRLLGVDPPTARARLGPLVFDDPAAGRLATAADYLSGNVRAKLAAARHAAATNPMFAANVAALEAVQPVELTPADIDARPGAPWIDEDDVAAFAQQTLDCPTVIVEHVPLTATWTFTAAGGGRNTVAMTSEWGTDRADALHLLDALCNQRAVTVYDETDGGRRVPNPAATIAAREKAEALSDAFAAWMWADPDRAERLASRYNDRFNAVVLPAYDGAHLTLPGLAADFAPHPHQRDAVWRIVSEPTVLLAHAVGAGKTATMVIAGMELRRLGLVTKPAYVVANHMLEQFSRELLQLYPQARILVADKDDIGAAARKTFVARCATGDWDAIVLTHASFARIPVAADTKARFLQNRVDGLRAAIAASEAGAGLSVKRLQQALLREEERHRRLLAEHRRDDGVSFEATGIDYLFVDEAHAYKNLHFPTRIQGVGGDGSERAEDLAMKLGWLRDTHGARVATLATATPIANSVAEMFVAQTYLQPDALAAAGIASFDAWAATFGRTVTALELAPDGASYRMHTRFARFANVPELLRLFRAVADVRTTDQLGLSIPDIAGGKPDTVVIAPSDGLTRYVDMLVGRAEAVRNRTVRPEDDNMLKVSGDGRKAALHLRLVGEPADPDHGKLAAAAERIAAIHALTATHRFQLPNGAPSPRPGGLQLVFCDLGTPKADGAWSVYAQLRALLAERGIPAERVAFIHDAANDRAKADLFAACRDGRISVLVGSTEKMGVGTNVQARAVALHHLDCPWRPADIEQREGRLLRQGNQNPAVDVVRYVTEGSFDVYCWQTVERKAGFIHQIMRGDITAREIDDVGDQALSFAEVKALATGNPLILERAGLAAEAAKLSRLKAAHHTDQARLTRTRDSATQRAKTYRRAAAGCDQALAVRTDTRGDRFTATIGDAAFTARTDAAAAVRDAALTAAHGLRAGDRTAGRPISVGGVPIALTVTKDLLGTTIELAVSGVAVDPIRVTLDELRAGGAGTGLLARVEHRVHTLERTRAELLERADTEDRQATQAAERVGRPFDHDARLAALTRRLEVIDVELTPDDPASPTTAPTAPPATADIGL